MRYCSVVTTNDSIEEKRMNIMFSIFCYMIRSLLKMTKKYSGFTKVLKWRVVRRA